MTIFDGSSNCYIDSATLALKLSRKTVVPFVEARRTLGPVLSSVLLPQSTVFVLELMVGAVIS